MSRLAGLGARDARGRGASYVDGGPLAVILRAPGSFFTRWRLVRRGGSPRELEAFRRWCGDPDAGLFSR